MDELVSLRKEFGTATVTLSQPHSLNVLSQQMLHSLESVFTRLTSDREVRCVVVASEGRVFSAGADLRELQSLAPEDALQYAERGQRVLALLENLRVPSIAQLGGAALGGGCELALAATFRIASSEAIIGLPEVSLGLIPGFGGTQRLQRLVGSPVARRMILLSEKLSALQALHIGLVDLVYEPSALTQGTAKMAAQLSGSSRSVLRAASEAISAAHTGGPDAGFRAEAGLFADVFKSSDRVEGLAAFFAKRPPQFS